MGLRSSGLTRAPVLAAVDETWKHSFQRELDIAIKLAHPNVIELYDVIFWDRVRLLSALCRLSG